MLRPEQSTSLTEVDRLTVDISETKHNRVGLRRARPKYFPSMVGELTTQ